jgi:hypothetical protein
MRFRLRTLLFVAALVPPLVAGAIRYSEDPIKRSAIFGLCSAFTCALVRQRIQKASPDETDQRCLIGGQRAE